MKKNFYLLLSLLCATLATTGFMWPFSWLFSNANNQSYSSQAWINTQINILRSQASNIDARVLRLSLLAYQNARKNGLENKGLLTVIDYSKPSYERRMWVFDVINGRNLYNTWVAHGKNSGEVSATSFSNVHGSLKSSIGVFLTASPYFGKNGYSLKLNGLERGINDNAAKRAVVIHGAWYANPNTIHKYGQLGRSWGCPAISTELSRPLINTIKDKTLVVAYYPDQRWINSSKFFTA